MQRYPLVLVNGYPQELPDNDRIIHSANVVRSATAPATPAEGDLWFNTAVNGLRVFDGTTWVVVVGGAGSSTVGVSATAPSPAVNGLLWYDTNTGLLKIYIAATTAWVPCETRLFVQSTAPASGVEQGDIWYNDATGGFSMYIGGAANSWIPLVSQTLIVETEQVINQNLTLSAGTNGFSVGPVEVAATYAVTVPANATWMIG